MQRLFADPEEAPIMSISMIGTIRRWHQGLVIPHAWLPCDGRTLPIDETYRALFSVIGNRFGGDGVTNFALPKVDPVVSETGSYLGPVTRNLPAMICYLGELPRT